MNEYLRSRILGIQSALMAVHEGGAGMPSAMIGGERELVVSGFLSQVLPPSFRFGTGVITDSEGNLSGQTDIAVELPFGPSFLMPAGSHRLYLAESVAAAIEVKSELSSSWNDVERTVSGVRRLKRDLRQVEQITWSSSASARPEIKGINGIPTYVIAFKGYETLEGLNERMMKIEEQRRPHGVLILKGGLFTGQTGSDVGGLGIYKFIVELTEIFNSAIGVAFPNFQGYEGS